jgi:8-oxo-dGTP pyrophosphatase MutT (NUDIX family)
VATIGVNIAILQNNSILLTQREDFEVWCLPGGHIDSGESFAQAAIREAREETGLDVHLTRFVGSYTRPQWSDGLYHIHLFTAEIIGGDMRTEAGETLEIRFFPIDNLPADMLVGHRHRVQDAADGLTGVVKTELTGWPFTGMDRWQTYRMRDESGLSRIEFYRQHFADLTPEQIIVEVAGTRTQ